MPVKTPKMTADNYQGHFSPTVHGAKFESVFDVWARNICMWLLVYGSSLWLCAAEQEEEEKERFTL